MTSQTSARVSPGKGFFGKTWMWMTVAGVAGLLGLMASGASAQPPANGNGKRLIEIKTGEDGKTQVLTVKSKTDSGFSLVELVNPKTKAVEKVLYAGTISEPLTIYVRADETIKPGTYTVRVRDGVEVALDKPIDRPDTKDGKWVNPTGVTIQNGAIYIVDAGLETPALVLEPNPEKEWLNEKKEKVKGTYVLSAPDSVTIKPSDNPNVTVALPLALQPVDLQEFVKQQVKKVSDWEALKASRMPALVKMNLDGSKVTNWGSNGVVTKVPLPPGWLRTLVVDEGGVGYTPSGGHHVLRVGQLGQYDEKFTVAGWDGNPAGPVCTVWVSSLALAGPKKMYIPNGGYGTIKVYDPTKPGFEGILYAGTFRSQTGGNGIAADGHGNVYNCDPGNIIVKYEDNGKALVEKYFTDPELKLYVPLGINTSGSLVLFACHGPGAGPFWDSGGGHEFVILWDNGKEFVRVTRFGAPGFTLQNKEFLNASAIAITPDHSSLICVEDGAANTDGPAGNARVTRMKLKHSVEDAIALELKPVK